MINFDAVDFSECSSEEVTLGVFHLYIFTSKFHFVVSVCLSRMFSRLQYFDSSGLFITLVYNVPLLINCLVMIVS